ncbi:SCO family protein [Szabonella alba]|uniref:SCO family protein n=1 Tax=Szabonella alba TaxID=2804194 RepID=A0A8K0V5Z8_9RHOB|nr:SCO family protein [Szabonella alba]MBL4916374.1 SCO family protein [Szabonella alba]
MAQKPSLRRLRFVLWGLVLIAGLGATWLFMPGRTPPQPEAQLTDTLGQGEYRLVTTEGQPFTESSLTGQPSLVFFGFTHCPDVCPTTLGEILGWKDTLGPLAGDLKVWLVTVDPERDTPEVLRDYVSWLPGATGVTGEAAELEKALQSFRIFARRVPLEGGSYTMDHSAYVMLFDDQGRYNQIFTYQEDPEQVTAKLRRFLEGQG